jgi:hypothetical protein
MDTIRNLHETVHLKGKKNDYFPMRRIRSFSIE